MRMNFLSFFTLFLFACSTSFAQYEHYIPYHKGNLWGYKDASTGQVLIDPKFEKEPDFFDHWGLAKVRIGYDVCIINASGKTLLCDQNFQYSVEKRGIVVSFLYYQNNYRKEFFSFFDFTGKELLSRMAGSPVALTNLIYIRNGDTLSVYYHGMNDLKFLRKFTGVNHVQYDLTSDNSRSMGLYVELTGNPTKLFFIDTLGKTKFIKNIDEPMQEEHWPVISPPTTKTNSDRLRAVGSHKAAPGMGVGSGPGGRGDGARREYDRSKSDSILRILYDTVWHSKGELYAAVKKGSHWGVVDTNDKVIVKMAYKRIFVLSLKTFAIPYGSKGNQDPGTIASNFVCFLAIDQNNRYSILLPNGKVTTGNYSHIQRLSGPGFVSRDSTGWYGIITIQGNSIIEIAPKFMKDDFGNTHSAVTKDCRFCYFFRVDDNGFGGWLRADGVEFYER
jgi:hypothetical protein